MLNAEAGRVLELNQPVGGAGFNEGNHFSERFHDRFWPRWGTLGFDVETPGKRVRGQAVDKHPGRRLVPPVVLQVSLELLVRFGADGSARRAEQSSGTAWRGDDCAGWRARLVARVVLIRVERRRDRCVYGQSI